MTIKDIIKFVAWEIVNPVVLKAKKNRHYHYNYSYAGMNLGCGIDNPLHWLGIDGGVYLLLQIFKYIPKPIVRIVYNNFFTMSKVCKFESYFERLYMSDIIHHDLLYGIPFSNNTIPAIYSSHFLEHLFKLDAIYIVSECYRVLRPGGIIRICVPSLDDQVSRMKDAILSYENGETDKIQPFVTSELVGFNNKYSCHKYMYNFGAMERLLSQAGFANISKKDFRIGDIRDVEKLDKRESLFVEAMKPF